VLIKQTLVWIKHCPSLIEEVSASINASVASKKESAASINDPFMWITRTKSDKTPPVGSVDEGTEAFGESGSGPSSRSTGKEDSPIAPADRITGRLTGPINAPGDEREKPMTEARK
jgi:hypothetical protein